MIKVVKFRKLRGNKKKYEITFNKNGKKYVRKFGAAGMSDFTIHKDKERRERYISRHKKDLKTKDPMKPGYLSMFILWNKPSLRASLADYKRRLGVYNRTGKFPIKISGSKKLKFGMISSLLDYAPVTKAREWLHNKGDELGMSTLKNIGVDPYIRTDQQINEVGIRDADQRRNAIMQRGYDVQRGYDFIEEMPKEILPQDMGPFEMKGRRIDNSSRRQRKKWSELMVKYKKGSITPDPSKEWELIDLPYNFGYSVPKNVVNKKLYLSIRNKLKKSIKGRRWGAYDSGRLVKMYKKKGGKYSGKKGKTNLGRWYKEKWVDACAWPKRKPCGRQTKSKIAYCRPSKRVDSKTPKLIQSLSRSTIKSRCARKRKNPKKRINPKKSRFGSWSRDFFEALMNAQPYQGEDITEACRRTIKKELLKRCGQAQMYKDRCDKILAELFLNIYNSVYSKIPYQRKYNIRQTFQPFWDNLEKEKFPDHIIDYDKLKIILGLLQDEFLPWTKDVAILASALLYGIEEL